MNNRKNAYKEVYTILQELNEEEYNKIPLEIIEAIRLNMNEEYEYELDEELELKDHQMLPETKAILFNLFRDYLATPEQKAKIIKLQAEERRKNEEIKTANYYKDKEEKVIHIKVESKKDKLDLLPIENKSSFWDKFKRKIKSIFYPN